MSNTAITQTALANSLKKLMLSHSINHIHVKMITDDCGFTRHTFYNHFHDVYELLGWIFSCEVIDGVDQYCTLDQWQQGLQLILDYTADNRIICLNTYRSLGRDHLEAFLQRVFYRFLFRIIEDISKSMVLSEDIKLDCCEFYSNALMGVFISWLKRDLRETPQQMLKQIDQMMSGNIVNTLSKFDRS
ncbi:TetR-like C-terminal domain-containing protein [Desulfosporosinus sp. OT]|uniref:TetR/AcrR family transcriptional regulator n=1 Tax=Desulfosporosinus sp. OT TaxID=913865 RepID=UPI00058F5800|nr:TetR-like C-terminal domain-containing protein [Desulfosporosinus sp. OT]